MKVSSLKTIRRNLLLVSCLFAFITSTPLVDAFQPSRSPLSIGSSSLSRSFSYRSFDSTSAISTISTTTISRTNNSNSNSSTRLNSMWSSDEINGPDKIKACIPYILPILDGDFFGKYIYQRVPPLHTLDELFLKPLVEILQAYPLLSIALFILLSLGSRFSTDINRNVRFNAQQAVLIDIVLVLPTLVQDGLADVDIPRFYSEFGCNFVWYFYMSAVVYSIAMNLRGKKPDGLPYLSQFAEQMTGPF
jgi:hypothetical protein